MKKARDAVVPPAATIDPDPTKQWLRRLWPIIWSHKWLFGLSMLLFLLGLGCQVLIPDLLNRAIGESIQSDERPLWHFVAVIAGLAVAAGLIGFVARYMQLAVAYAVEYDLRNVTFEHLSRLSSPFFDQVRTGELISRANSDIRAVQTCLAMVPQVIIQCCMAVLAFAIMFTINPLLTLVTMGVLPFTLLFGIIMGRQMLPASWLTQSRIARIASIVDESISGDRVVKAFGAESRQVRKLAASADSAEWAFVKEADIRARWTPLIQNLPNFGMVIVLGVGGYLAITAGANVGEILAFSVYLVMLQAPFSLLGLVLMALQRASAASSRIFEILDTVPTIVDPPVPTTLGDAETFRVSFEDVDFSYRADGERVLDGLSIDFRPGETVAIVGATGSGKSTIGRLLTRLYDVDAGAVRVNGVDIRDLSLVELRGIVGVVSEESFIFSSSVADNIAYTDPAATEEQILDAAALSGAAEFIGGLPQGYETLVGERGYGLSGGQRQRLAIARTILANPAVLILDDATSAIDVSLEAAIHESFRDLMADRTTIIVAHRISTIALADRVILLEHGRVVADGAHEDLAMTSPEYRDLLGLTSALAS